MALNETNLAPNVPLHYKMIPEPPEEKTEDLTSVFSGSYSPALCIY